MSSSSSSSSSRTSISSLLFLRRGVNAILTTTSNTVSSRRGLLEEGETTISMMERTDDDYGIGKNGINSTDNNNNNNDDGLSGNGGTSSLAHDLFHEHYRYFVMLIAGIGIFMLLSSYIAKFVYQRYWLQQTEEDIRRHNQELYDRQIAASHNRIQREIRDINHIIERRRRSRMRRVNNDSSSYDENDEIERVRKERLEWYATFLRPYKMTLKGDDFVAEEGAVTGTARERSVVANIADDGHRPTAKAAAEMNIFPKSEDFCPSSSAADEVSSTGVVESHRCYIRTPPRDKNKIEECGGAGCGMDGNCNNNLNNSCHGCCCGGGGGGRGNIADGLCTICLRQYVVGDTVIWSAVDNNVCPHVFHEECIMMWLSTGKKRCPVCRRWFVPSEKIDDQKKRAFSGQEEEGERDQNLAVEETEEVDLEEAEV